MVPKEVFPVTRTPAIIIDLPEAFRRLQQALESENQKNYYGWQDAIGTDKVVWEADDALLSLAQEKDIFFFRKVTGFVLPCPAGLHQAYRREKPWPFRFKDSWSASAGSIYVRNTDDACMIMRWLAKEQGETPSFKDVSLSSVQHACCTTFLAGEISAEAQAWLVHRGGRLKPLEGWLTIIELPGEWEIREGAGEDWGMYLVFCVDDKDRVLSIELALDSRFTRVSLKPRSEH